MNCFLIPIYGDHTLTTLPHSILLAYRSNDMDRELRMRLCAWLDLVCSTGKGSLQRLTRRTVAGMHHKHGMVIFITVNFS